MKINICKYFWRSSLADLPPALQVSESLMPETLFHFKLNKEFDAGNAILFQIK